MRAHGYADGNFDISGYGRFVVSLIPEATISGRVVDVDGGWVANARVSAAGLREVATTDESGRFSSRSVRPGRYALIVTAARRFGTTKTPINVGIHDNVTGVEIVTEAAYSISGQVVSQQGKLPSGLKVLGGPQATSVGVDGRFTLEGIRPGSHTLSVSSDLRRFPFDPQTGHTIAVGKADVTDVELAAEAVGQVTIVAVGEDGTAAVGVHFNSKQEDGQSLQTHTCRTDSDGRCQMTGLKPVVLTDVKPRIASFPPKQMQPSATAELNFVLPKLGAVAGRVRTANGDPLAGAAMSIKPSAQPDGKSSLTFRVSTDSEGRFLFGGLAAGPYLLEVTASAGASPMSAFFGANDASLGTKAVDVRDGQLVSGVEFSVVRDEGPLEGRVVDTDGHPQPEVLVTCAIDLENWFYSSGLPRGIKTVMTNERGEFAFARVVKGNNYRLFALGAGGVQGQMRGLKAGRKDAELTTRIPSEIIVHITKRIDATRRIEVVAESTAGELEKWPLSLTRMERTSGDDTLRRGTVSFVGIAPGKWTTVTISADGDIASRDVTVKVGGQSTIEFDLTDSD